MATAQEIKDYAQSLLHPELGYTTSALTSIIGFMADAMNKPKEGFKSISIIVKSELFSLNESISIQDGSTKLIPLDENGISVLSVEKLATGIYRVTTGYNDSNASNIKDNGIINIQAYQDINSTNITGLDSDINFLSAGVFDVFISQNAVAKDYNFYLTINLFNFS
ncbi:hypothetical protein [Polaribacter aestuariivivens]|uniref:hypothetical protein n=1 Tax=Polaribacter aestuariivivens TaxID=2304626 RepID=UPI003F49170B